MEEQRTIRLVLEAQAGSREAFGQLVNQFETTVFATVMSRLRNRAEAREVTQDVFVQVYNVTDQGTFGASLVKANERYNRFP